MKKLWGILNYCSYQYLTQRGRLERAIFYKSAKVELKYKDISNKNDNKKEEYCIVLMSEFLEIYLLNLLNNELASFTINILNNFK